MAKVTGPLMSFEASGTLGDTITFAKWVGRPYVRRHVIPANPQTAAQEDTRNAFSVLGKATSWAGSTTMTGNGRTQTDAEAIQAISPSDQRWNGFVVSQMTQTSLSAYNDAIAAWGALDPTAQSDWDSAAGALSPAMQPAPQRMEGGGSDTPISAGNVFFVWEYALFILGIETSAPGATPPTYT